MKKLNTRKDKISILQGITSGKISLNELAPPQVQVWIKGHDTWKNFASGDLISHESYSKLKESSKKDSSLFISIIPAT